MNEYKARTQEIQDDKDLDSYYERLYFYNDEDVLLDDSESMYMVYS